MRPALIGVAGRMLLLFVSAGAVCATLGATAIIVRPEAAFVPVADPLAGLFARTVLPGGRTDGAVRPAPTSGFVGPGLGWG